MARLALCTLLALAACGASPAPATAPSPAAAAVEGLLRAPPSQWSERVPAVLQQGRAAVPALLEGLARDPDAPGAQAAVAVLGAAGDRKAAPLLCQLLADRGPLAVEAAIALGQLGDPAAVEPLRGTAEDRLADATLRAACAGALLRLHHGAEVAPLIRALLLAGTPAGAEGAAALGLPARSRWALERYLLQRALLAAAGTDFGLDTDATWPDLEQAAAAVDAWLRRGG